MLAEQIKSHRIQAGMTQLQLAEILSIGPSAIGMYEQGRRTPSVEILIQMSNLFGVSLDYLITGKEFTRSAIGQMEIATQYVCPCRRCNSTCNGEKVKSKK